MRKQNDYFFLKIEFILIIIILFFIQIPSVVLEGIFATGWSAQLVLISFLFAHTVSAIFPLMMTYKFDYQVIETKSSLTIHDITRTPKVYEIFKEHLDKEFCSETYLCYDELQKLALLPESKDKDEIAGQIIDTYIKEGAPKEINISHTERSKVLDTANTNDWEPLLQIQTSILQQLELDSFPRFIRRKDLQIVLLNNEL